MSIFERLRRRQQVEAQGAELQGAPSGVAEHIVERERAVESLAEVPFAGERRTDDEELKEREREIIAALPNAVEETSLEEVNRQIGFAGADAKHERRVLAFMTGKGFDNYMAANQGTIEKFLEKYPTPVEFDEPSKNFLKMIENANSEDKLHEYEDAMHNFKLHVYGKQYRKWQELQNVDEFAEEKTEKWTGEREKINQPRVVVNGDMWIENRRGYKLTPEILAENGLEPRYNIENVGRKMQLSMPWKVGEREAIAAYVEDANGNINVENYYRSGPKRFWRKLSEYIKDEPEYVGENAKETVLPEAMQKNLSAVAQFGEQAEVRDNPRFLLEGAAKRYDSAEDYLAAKRRS